MNFGACDLLFNKFMTKEIIQKIRTETGAGVMDIKKALTEANGDENQALEILKKRGQEIAAKKQAEREAGEGIVASLIVLGCETDFVAKNQEFKNLAHDIAMQITAMNPKNVEALLGQNSIQDDNKTIQDLINEATAKLGEKVEIKKITRFEI